jgi:Auxiliary Activity family 9 (formerly GH61)
VAIPKCILPGDYLLRAEHIGLHAASSSGGAQFYISCAQLHVSGGGSNEPASSFKVAFPGAYKASDPGILININYPVPTSYLNPGPEVFSC